MARKERVFVSAAVWYISVATSFILLLRAIEEILNGFNCSYYMVCGIHRYSVPAVLGTP